MYWWKTFIFCYELLGDLQALSVHSPVHSGLKPYRCHLCSQTFTQSSSLRTHIKRHEMGNLDPRVRYSYDTGWSSWKVVYNSCRKNMTMSQMSRNVSLLTSYWSTTQYPPLEVCREFVYLEFSVCRMRKAVQKHGGLQATPKPAHG